MPSGTCTNAKPMPGAAAPMATSAPLPGSGDRRSASVLLTVTAGMQVSEVITSRYNHVLDDIRTMITHVGSSSNLILDPDLDSYYLIIEMY